MDLLKIGKIKETISNYIKVRLELFKLDLTEHISHILAQLIAYLIILIISTIVITFLSIALAQYLNTQLESTSIGYVIVSAIYLIILLIVYYFLKSGKLKAYFESILVDNITNKSDSDETE